MAVDDAIKKRKSARLTFESNLEAVGLQLEHEEKIVSESLITIKLSFVVKYEDTNETCKFYKQKFFVSRPILDNISLKI